QAVADADDPKLQGSAARQTHPRLHRLGDLVQVQVAGDEFVKGIGHPDQWLVDLPVGESHGLEEGAVGIFFQTQLHQVASHAWLLNSTPAGRPGTDPPRARRGLRVCRFFTPAQWPGPLPRLAALGPGLPGALPWRRVWTPVWAPAYAPAWTCGVPVWPPGPPV